MSSSEAEKELTLKEALRYMNTCHAENHRRFDVEFVTLDLKRASGGKLKSLKRCHVTGASHNMMEHGTISVQDGQSARPTPVHIYLIQKVDGRFING